MNVTFPENTAERPHVDKLETQKQNPKENEKKPKATTKYIPNLACLREDESKTGSLRLVSKIKAEPSHQQVR
jgi:hypothetical protein